MICFSWLIPSCFSCCYFCSSAFLLHIIWSIYLPVVLSCSHVDLSAPLDFLSAYPLIDRLACCSLLFPCWSFCSFSFFCLYSDRSTYLPVVLSCYHVDLSASFLFSAYNPIDLHTCPLFFLVTMLIFLLLFFFLLILWSIYIPARCSFLLPCWSFCSSCFLFLLIL